MTGLFAAALTDGNFAALHQLYTHGVVLHLPGQDIHSRPLVIAHDLALYQNCGGPQTDRSFRIESQWLDHPQQIAFTFRFGGRSFAGAWRTQAGRVVEIWQAESRPPEPLSLPPVRLLPPFAIVHQAGQLAPAKQTVNDAAGQLHNVWNRRDLRPLAHHPSLHSQAAALLHRFPHLTVAAESKLQSHQAELIRWRMQASHGHAIIDLFAFSRWQQGVWTETYLDEAVLEAQLNQPAPATLGEDTFR